MSVYNDLLQYSSGQKPWLTDLIRRAVTQTTLTAQDLQELEGMIRNSNLAQELQQETVRPVPLNSSHLPSSQQTDTGQVTLAGLFEVENVDRLVSNQSLPFIEKGITIVYGDNGSGKSGYCRILKQLCRARQEQPEQILGDAFVPGSKPSPRATIRYAIGGVAQPVYEWVDTETKPLPACLGRITVFDASAAPLYADKQNEIEFLPRGLDVLPNVGSALEIIARRFDEEIETLQASTQSTPLRVSSSTRAGKLLERLCSTEKGLIPTAQEIEATTLWDQSSEQRLAEIQRSIGELTEPERNAKQLRLSAKSIANLANGVEAVFAKINAASLEIASEAISGLRAAREAAKLAAEEQFATEPLGKGVGSNPWRSLFQYAREFSALVYPGEEFPVVGPGKLCPLCQQPLSTEASQRFIRFQQFVENRAQQTLESTQDRCGELTKSLDTLNLPSQDDLTPLLAPLLGSNDESHRSLAEQVPSFYLASATRLVGIKNFLAEKIPADAIPECPIFPVSSLRRISDELNEKAAQFEAMKTDRSQIEQLQTERIELEATKALNQNVAILMERRAKLEQLKFVQACRKSCNTHAISLKNNELREKYLTKEMKGRVRKEIASMGLSYLPLKIEARTDHGASMMGVALEKTVKVKTSRILSEGEFRALALACFFAEVDSIPGQSAIIVDDPVSSLDHLRMRQVSRRIVEEATKRQVIVFTHDLIFYYDLWEAAGENGVQIATHQLRRQDPTVCGAVVLNDAPWQAKSVNERIAFLEAMINGMPDPTSRSAEEHWRNAENFYTCLRETLERFVEEKVLSQVVSRFQSGVMTQRLKLVVVDDEDYRTIFWKMRRASTFSGHDTAIARQTSPPSIQDMRKDIEDLRIYAKELKKRQTEASNRRESCESPPTVNLAEN